MGFICSPWKNWRSDIYRERKEEKVSLSSPLTANGSDTLELISS